MEKLSRNLPSQFPAFRLMVARQMEGHRERIATRIRREAAKRGESAPDLAHALGVYPSTAERWFRGDRTPQRRHRKDLAEHWGLEPDWAEIDLATEEQDVRDQLDRIEEALEDLVGATALLLADAGDQKIARRIEQAAEQRRKRRQGGSGSD